MAEPPCHSPYLTLIVHGAREGPLPRAQVSSLLALPCPLSGLPTPPGGVDAPPCSTSLGVAIVAALVKPKAKRPRATAGWCCSCADDLPVIPAPDIPRPLLVLLGGEPRRPYLHWPLARGCLAAVLQGLAVAPLSPPPPPVWGRLLAALLCCPPPPPPPPPRRGPVSPVCGAATAVVPSPSGSGLSLEGGGCPLAVTPPSRSWPP